MPGEPTPVCRMPPRWGSMERAPPRRYPRLQLHSTSSLPLPPWPRGAGPSCAGFAAVSTLGIASCAVCESGAVYCWGEPSLRAVAQGVERKAHEVVRIEGIDDALAVATSLEVACALTRTGRVKCWGRGDIVGPSAGHGAGTKEPVIAEAPLPAKAVALGVGDLHGCALLETAEVACWGQNDWGQVGVERAGTGMLAPVVLPGLRARTIAVAGNLSCAIDDGRRAWCWGWNGSGAMAAGDTEQHAGPVRIERLDEVVDLVTYGGRVCARRADQGVWCWGQDVETGTAPSRPMRRGEVPSGRLAGVDGDTLLVLGVDGTVSIKAGGAVAKVVVGLPPARALASGNGGRCAILRSGELRCWGTNLRGELVLGVEGKP